MTRLLVAAALAATAVGLVHVLRNRLLALFVPRLVAALRKRFGDAADVREVELDERWNLAVSGLRVPLPGGMLAEVERAVVSGIAGLSLPGGRGGLRVREARGVLALVGDEHAVAALALPFVYRLDAGETTHPVDGIVEVREGTWAHRRDDLEGTPYVSADLHLSASEEGFRLTEGRVHLGEGTLHLTARGPLDAGWTAELRAEPMTGALLEHLAALVDPALEVRWPAGLAVSGLVRRGPAGIVQATLEATTPGSELAAEVTRSADGELSGAVTGKVAMAELTALSVFPPGLAPLPSGEVVVDAKLSGTLAEPAIAGAAFLPELALCAGAPESNPVYRFREVSAPFRLRASELVITGLTARPTSGKLTASSTIEFGIWPVQHASEIEWQEVQVADLPTGPSGEHGLARFVSASASGRARVVGEGGDLDLLTAEGDLTLSDPDYHFMTKAASALSGYGLLEPSTRGTGPCRAQLAVSGGVLRLSQIAGELEGVAFRGEASARLDASVAGRLTVALGKLEVPLTIAGTVHAPEVTVDVKQALGGLLAKPAVSKVVGAIGTMLTSSRPAPPSGGPEMDATLEAILAGGDDADRLMDQLIETGITPDEVRDLLQDYRRRRGV